MFLQKLVRLTAQELLLFVQSLGFFWSGFAHKVNIGDPTQIQINNLSSVTLQAVR